MIPSSILSFTFPVSIKNSITSFRLRIGCAESFSSPNVSLDLSFSKGRISHPMSGIIPTTDKPSFFTPDITYIPEDNVSGGLRGMISRNISTLGIGGDIRCDRTTEDVSPGIFSINPKGCFAGCGSGITKASISILGCITGGCLVPSRNVNRFSPSISLAV